MKHIIYFYRDTTIVSNIRDKIYISFDFTFLQFTKKSPADTSVTVCLNLSSPLLCNTNNLTLWVHVEQGSSYKLNNKDKIEMSLQTYIHTHMFRYVRLTGVNNNVPKQNSRLKITYCSCELLCPP